MCKFTSFHRPLLPPTIRFIFHRLRVFALMMQRVSPPLQLSWRKDCLGFSVTLGLSSLVQLLALSGMSTSSTFPLTIVIAFIEL